MKKLKIMSTLLAATVLFSTVALQNNLKVLASPQNPRGLTFETDAPNLNLECGNPDINIIDKDGHTILIGDDGIVILNGYASDNSGVKVTINGEVKIDAINSNLDKYDEKFYHPYFDINKTFKDGDKLKIEVEDSFGNKTTKTYDIKYDHAISSYKNNINDGDIYNKDVNIDGHSDFDTGWYLDDGSVYGNDFNYIVSDDGSHILKVIGSRNFNTVLSKLINFKIDRIAPNLDILNVENNGTYSHFTPKIQTDKDSTLEMTLNDNPYTGEPITKVGNYTLKVKSTNASGHFAQRTIEFKVRDMKPTLTLLEANNYATDNTLITYEKNRVRIKGTIGDDNKGYKLLINGEEKLTNIDTNTKDFDYEIPVVEGQTIKIKVIDSAGQETEKEVNVVIKKNEPIQSNGPIKISNLNSIVNDGNLTLNGNWDNVNNLDKINVNGSAVNMNITSMSSISFGSYSNSYSSGNFTTNINLNKGVNNISLQAYDTSGNFIQSESYEVFYDSKPTLDINEPNISADGTVIINDNKIKVKGTIGDDNTGYKLFINGEEKLTNIDTNTKDFDYEIPVTNGQTIKVKVIDSVGNEIEKEFKVLIKLNGDRISGSDRYETSYNVFEKGWTSSQYAVLVPGSDYPDALCAAPLATKYKAPILLTQNNDLNAQPKLEQLLKDKGVKNVFIAGGVNMIPVQMEKDLASKGIKVTRLAGDSRYETSVKIAQEVTRGTNIKEVDIASGENFADGLSISSIAGKKGTPILLTKRDDLPKLASDYMKSINANKSYVIGSTGSITEGVKSQLPNSERIGGADRYETNRLVYEKFSSIIDKHDLYVSSARVFPDALSISALAGKNGNFVVLSDSNAVTSDTLKTIDEIRASKPNVHIAGGQNSVSNDVVSSLDINLK